MLRVHRGERTSALAHGLRDVMSTPLPDPFAPEVVAVPTRGVERWLTQQLSLRLGVTTPGLPGTETFEDGVCANVQFPSPARLVRDVVAAASGHDPREDPWRPEALVWPILDVLEESGSARWARPVARYLSPDGREVSPGRRLVLASALARLFARYDQARPEMITGWAGGDDTDGRSALPQDLLWQPELWRTLRSRLGVSAPAERLPAVREQLQGLGRDEAIGSGAHALVLPPRLSVFGATSLPRVQLDVLADLARHREVHLWLPHPSPALWDALEQLPPVRRRRDDRSGDLVAHPLLASLGRDVRELQQRLVALSPSVEHHEDSASSTSSSASGAGGGEPTLLQRLQASIRDDADIVPAAARGGLPVLSPEDRSVQVHACHGAARQVEVLREVLVGLLADDPTLEPRDVLVMCPDVEAFAPLITATFGLVDDDATDVHPGHRLRVRLADRSLRQTNPVLALLTSLVELAAGRVTASQVLDLVTQAPVRRRFGLSDDDIERVTGWALATAVRWGMDEADRARAGVPGIAQGTWRLGLDRILLGAAVSDEIGALGTVLAYDDVDSTDLELAGRLGELFDRVETAVIAMRGRHSLEEWCRLLRESLDALASVGPSEEWQRLQADQELADLAAEAGSWGARVALDLADVQALLSDRLQGRATRANFRTGSLTVASMLPMRSVPHRVICLLGLDDGAFPRQGRIDGDDVLARDPWLGERDPRTEDRQLLLDALMAAEEAFVVIHTGADPRTGAEHPPAVPIGELLDAADALAQTEGGEPARRQVLVRHPLQPFDPRCFLPHQLGVPRAFSFDRATNAAAQRAREPRLDVNPYRDRPLPPPAEELAEGLAQDPSAAGGILDPEVTLDELVAFVTSPAKAFLVQRLGVSLPWEQPVVSDRLVVTLDGLSQWQVADRVLQHVLAGVSADDALRAELLRGELPPRQLGVHYRDNVLVPELRPLVAATEPYRLRDGQPVVAEVVDVAVTLPDGTAISGAVSGVRGDVVLSTSYSRLKPKQRLAAWVRLLALVAARPDVPWQAVTVGRGDAGERQTGSPRPRRSMIEGVDAEEARSILATLVGLRAQALAAPLPFAPRTSLAYARDRLRPIDPSSVQQAEVAAARCWEPSSATDKTYEGGDRENALVWGQPPDFGLLLEQPARTMRAERTRFGELALTVWEPLLRHETEVLL